MGLLDVHVALCFVNACVQGNTALKMKTLYQNCINTDFNILATTTSVVSLDQNSAQIISLYAPITTPLCQFLRVFFAKWKMFQYCLDILKNISAKIIFTLDSNHGLSC